MLVRPEIPQNTGSIARLAAATTLRLHLVGPLGFSLEDRYLKRAGLDYWPLVDLRTYAEWDDFGAAEHQQSEAASRALEVFFGARRSDPTWRRIQPGDFLVFGSETKGLGEDFMRTRTEAAYRIPIFEPGVRSLNLANAVSIVLYEALRQSGRLSA